MILAGGVLGRLGRLWREAGVDVWSQLVGSTWPAGIEIVGGKCRILEESELIALFREKRTKRKKAAPCWMLPSRQVEMPGIEPGSEWTASQASTYIAGLLSAHPHRKPTYEARCEQRLIGFRRVDPAGIDSDYPI